MISINSGNGSSKAHTHTQSISCVFEKKKISTFLAAFVVVACAVVVVVVVVIATFFFSTSNQYVVCSYESFRGR